MRIFIMADMEGASGVCLRSQVMPDGAHYQAARRYLTDDVNAGVDGCFKGGADEVIVRDAHGNGCNFVWEQLDNRAEYVQGVSREERMPGIASCDGLILLGYHAMAGTPRAILEHTMSSAEWQNFWMNGRPCGEIGIDAGIAGDKGVPTIMVSGDDKTCAEARTWVKAVVAVRVKTGLDVEGGILLPREKAHALIRGGAERAVRACRGMKPLKVSRPVRMRLELVSRGRLPHPVKNRRILDGRTCEVTESSVERALNLLRNV